MNYSKYQDRLLWLCEKYTEEKNKLESKKYKVTVLLKNSEGDIIDIKKNLRTGEAYSEKYNNYIKDKFIDSNIMGTLKKLEEEFHKDLAEKRKEIVSDFLKDLAELNSVSFKLIEKIIELSLRRAFSVNKFTLSNITNSEGDFIVEEIKEISLEKIKSGGIMSEYLFAFIEELVETEIELMKLSKIIS